MCAHVYVYCISALFCLCVIFNRNRYRHYKDLYKKYLEYPEHSNIVTQMEKLEEDLDVANIVMAREQAKLEVCMSEYFKKYLHIFLEWL